MTVPPWQRSLSSSWDPSRVILRVPAQIQSSQSGSSSTWAVPDDYFPVCTLPAIVLQPVLRGTGPEPRPFFSGAKIAMVPCIEALEIRHLTRRKESGVKMGWSMTSVVTAENTALGSLYSWRRVCAFMTYITGNVGGRCINK